MWYPELIATLFTQFFTDKKYIYCNKWSYMTYHVALYDGKVLYMTHQIAPYHIIRIDPHDMCVKYI